MGVSPARRVAHEILVAVETRAAFASELLHGPSGRGLSAADRRLATAIVLGVLRWRAQLDFVLERAAARPLSQMDENLRAALRMGAFQLRCLERVPRPAAVHESVELAKRGGARAAGFANAVLRRCPTEPIAALLEGVGDPARRRAIEFSHPAWMLARWRRHYGEEAVRRIAAYDNAVPPVAVRPSSADGGAAAERLRRRLEAHAIAAAPGRLVRQALRVNGNHAAALAGLRTGGDFWIQDEASQLVALLLQPRPEDWVLDACAAPGAKASLLHAVAPAARLVALDLHPHRARLMRRLLPDSAVWIVAADAAAPLPIRHTFDRILVDAPCTGTGTLARNPEIRWRLTSADAARMQAVQLHLLRNLMPALRPGGRLVYSVCSLEPEEGEQVAERTQQEFASHGISLRPVGEIIEMLIAGEVLAPAAAAVVSGSWLRILPCLESGTDGFFAAVFERTLR